jgi:hypothetical protein
VSWCVVLAISLIVVPAILVRLNYSFQTSITARFAFTLAAASVLSAIPFFAAGMVITLAISRFTTWIDRVYAVDLVGAGIGAVAIVPLMWKVPAPLLLAALSLLAVAAALACADTGRRRAIAGGVGAVCALAVILGATTSLYHLPTPLPGAVTDRWTPLSRVIGYRQTGPFGVITYDRDYAPVPRYTRGQPLPDWRSLQLGPQSVGFTFAPRGRVLIIGGGGGRDIYNALSSGEPRVDVIELNRAIVQVTDHDLGPRFGSPYTLPRVHVRIGDGRSTLARSGARYQEINIGFTNTLSGNAAQGAALTENNLYTVEAFREYLDHLAPGGVLSVSRIYRLVGDEALRATILTLAALRSKGVTHPERNVVVLLGTDLLTAKPFGTILARLTPFTPAELASIKALGAQRTNGVAFAPGGPYRREWAGLAAAPSNQQFCSSYRVDVCPPTDDKPFFLNFERLSNIGQATPPGYLFTVKPFTVLLVALGILVVLCAIAFVLPLAVVARRNRPPARSLGFFAAIGVGFLVLEVTMIQRFVLFLGFPTYSLSVVLAGLLVFTGIGAALSGRWRAPQTALRAATSVAAVLIFVSAFALPPLLRSLIDLPFGARLLITVLILAPFGISMGMAMPIGLRRLSALHHGAVPWAWAINGISSVLASVLAITVATEWGFKAATLVAAASYVVAAAYAFAGSWPEASAPASPAVSPRRDLDAAAGPPPSPARPDPVPRAG